MKMPHDNIVVLDISGTIARLYSETEVSDTELENVGFQRSGNELSRHIIDDSDRQNLVRFLIGIGALFSSGRDWSPEELVEFYKEQGFTNQRYHVISWTGPERYIISER